jgi:predicted transcriptional regulator
MTDLYKIFLAWENQVTTKDLAQDLTRRIEEPDNVEYRALLTAKAFEEIAAELNLEVTVKEIST